MKYELNKIIHADCMDIMKDIPDKWFELAIVDPPYGININMNIGRRKNDKKKHKIKKWDNGKPDKKYFNELFRISKSQIIWGANNFNDLPPSNGWIIWDKCLSGNVDFSDAELAFSNVKNNIKIFKFRIQTSSENYSNKIHPTQKPIALYRWILQNYAKPNDKIIDTHSGSGSCAIACHLEHHDFLAIEKDIDYYNDSVKRLDEVRAQGVLF